jgi:TolB-like protein/DNA-binding winged helix-turn-helix (wHTH) protein/Tfp pilus assembly protein PilF
MSLSAQRLYSFGPFRLEPAERLLLRDGQPVPLPPKAYDLLVTLVAHAGHLVTKEDLLRDVWPGTFVEEANLSYTVSLVRKALGDDREPYRYIETVPKRGYRFKEPVAPPEAVDAPEPRARHTRRRLREAVAALIAGVAVTAIWLLSGSLREPVTGGASPRIASLGVLPLENLSGDPEKAYFVDGMKEALTAELSRIRALRVVPGTSTLRSQHLTKSLPEIARALNVDGLIEGSVLMAGNRVRVTVKLIHGASDRQLWGDSYERSLEDVLGLQTEVARAIAAQIRVAVTAEEARYLGRSSRVNPAAYQAYLQGNYLLAKGTPAAYEKAQEYFEQAIEHDPQYAPPHAGLAGVLVQLATMDGFLPAGAVHAPATTAVQKALALDPSLAEGHIALGRIKSRLEWDWAAADAAFRQGIQLGPSSSLARLQYANYLTAVGRFEESIAIGTRTVELDPLLPLAHQELGQAYHAAGRYDEALEMYRRALELDPEIRSSHFLRAVLYLRVGKTTEVINGLDALRRLVGDGGPPHRVGYLGYLYGKTGHRTEALRAVSELRKRSATDYVPPSSIGNVYVGLNRREDALDEFERAFAQHDPWMFWLKVHPLYDEIRNDPRFQELIRRMKFPG